MRIIFMGTPEFAVASLDALITQGYNVVAVVTAADKPAGRGQKLSESAVKKYALDKGLPVLQPVRLKDPEFLDQLKAFHADLQVVVAFRMLPEIVWNMPPKGTINLHASLLPHYRGAAPINWAIINGEKQTGITTFFLKQEIDTGNILFSETVDIGKDETAGELHDKLMVTGAHLLVKTVKAIEEDNYRETPQEVLLTETGTPDVKHAPKIFKGDCRIEWCNPLSWVYDHIRGLSPYPAAFTIVADKTIKIFKASPIYELHNLKPGEYQSNGKDYLWFACMDGFIDVKELQLEGKKKMGIEEFLRGNRL